MHSQSISEHQEEPTPEASKLVRSHLLGAYDLGEGRTLFWHPLNRTVVSTDELLTEMIAELRTPTTTRGLAQRFGLTQDVAREIVGNLRDALVLHPALQDEELWIRQKYATKLRPVPMTPGLQLLQPRQAPRTSPAEPSPVQVLGRAITVLPLDGGDYLVTHALGHPVRLTEPLWRFARSFARDECGQPRDDPSSAIDPRTASAARELLVAKGLLWPSHDAEHLAIRARYRCEEHISLMSFPILANRWRTGYRAYDLPLRGLERGTAEIALVGFCQLLAVAEPLEHIAAMQGWDLRAEAFMLGTAVGERPWTMVVVSPTLLAARLFEAAAADDLAQVRRCAAELGSRVDHVLARLREQTSAPVAFLALGTPGLSNPGVRARTELRTIIAELNEGIMRGLLAGGPGFLIDESELPSEVGFRGVYWDDEFNASPHHAPVSNWTYIDLPADSGDAHVDQEGLEALQPPHAPDQMDPAAALALALYHRFSCIRETDPVEAIVFEPNDLLWRGRLEQREEPFAGGGPHFYTADHYYFYAGIHEALSILARNGVRLVCRSTCPAELLRARWSFQSPLQNLIRLEDVQVIDSRSQGEDDLAGLSKLLDVPEARMLLVDLVSPPPPAFRGRSYAGDRWALRRYLLSSPDVVSMRYVDDRVLDPHRASTIAPAPLSLEAATPSTEEIASAIYEALRDRFCCDDATLQRVDDLRLLGLDSFGGVELMVALQERLGLLFDDSDFVATTVFVPSRLVQAAIRAAKRGSPDPRTTKVDLYGGVERSEWCARDVGALIRAQAEAPRVPWIFKCLRSAARFDAEYITWHQLIERAAGYAHRYRERGVQDQAVVMLVLPQGIELISAFVGAILAGAVPSICAHPSQKLTGEAFAEWFGVLVERSAAQLVVTTPQWELELGQALLRQGSSVPIEVEIPAPTATLPEPPPTTSTERPLVLQHSSGTTGLKKAVMLSHRDLLSQVWELSHALGCSEHDKIASWLPLYHDMGLVACLMLPLLCSIPTVTMSPFDWVSQPALLLEQISEEQATLCWLPNFAYQHIARRGAESAARSCDLSRLRAVINCSEPVTAPAMDAFYERLAPLGLRYSALSSSYAMAEATFAVTQSPPGRPPKRLIVNRDDFYQRGLVHVESPDAPPERAQVLVSSGRPLPRARIVILGDDGEALPDGHIGEISIESDSLMTGYYGDGGDQPAPHGGWFDTGDLGFMLEGELFVTGRKKDLIIVGGHNVHPHEVEESISRLESIRAGRVAAFGVFDQAEGTERLVVLAEAAGDASVELEDIRQLVLGTFGVVVSDVRIMPHQTLLKSTSGKLSRALNRARYLGDTR